MCNPSPILLLVTPAKAHRFTKLDVRTILTLVCGGFPSWGKCGYVFISPRNSVCRQTDIHMMETVMDVNRPACYVNSIGTLTNTTLTSSLGV